MAIPNVLTIAGSDPSGGAGIQADLKTFAAHRCFGTTVVTALTAQNTCGVSGVLPTDPGFVADQLATLLDDVRIDAVKIGMLGSVEVARVVADALRGPLAGVPVVLDPVMVATSGDSLATEGVREAITELLGWCSLVTPNLPEAAALTGRQPAAGREEMASQAGALLDMGAPAVLLKGGHLADGDQQVWDLVARRAQPPEADATGLDWLEGPRVRTRNSHGTGCTLSSAVAANLAHGLGLVEACRRAKLWLATALASSDQLQVGDGTGHGPVNHLQPSWVNRP